MFHHQRGKALSTSILLMNLMEITLLYLYPSPIVASSAQIGLTGVRVSLVSTCGSHPASLHFHQTERCTLYAQSMLCKAIKQDRPKNSTDSGFQYVNRTFRLNIHDVNDFILAHATRCLHFSHIPGIFSNQRTRNR